MNAPNSKKVVQTILGGRFEDDPTMRFGSSNSGHGVRFGKFLLSCDELVEVAAKPFISRRGVSKAQYEAKITETIRGFGFDTLDPVEVVAGQVGNVEAAVLLTHYRRGLVGGNTLSLDADPNTSIGRRVAQAAGKVAITTARLHSKSATHGDPQMKNFGFSTADTSTGYETMPLVFDLEKATLHAPKSSNRSHGFTCSNLENLTGGIRREWVRLSYSLGSRFYGDGSLVYFHDTVIEPYMEELDPTLKAEVSFLPIIESTLANFARSQKVDAPLQQIIGMQSDPSANLDNRIGSRV